MHYDLLKPCSDCPFLREGGVRLTSARVEEIAGMMLDTGGGTFPCHKTTVEAEDGLEREATSSSQHCAGALIFAEKNETATQMMRIAERLGMYDARKMMSDKKAVDSVFQNLEEMLECNSKDGQRRAKTASRLRRQAKV